MNGLVGRDYELPANKVKPHKAELNRTKEHEREREREREREGTLFVCLFVCWYKTRKTILRLLFLEGSKTPGSNHTRTQALLRA